MNLLNLKNINKDSQEKLAEITGVSQKTISNYLNETTAPTLKELCKLADYYNVSLDYLVGRDFNNSVGYLTENEKQLLHNFRQLSEETQLKFLAKIEGALIAEQK